MRRESSGTRLTTTVRAPCRYACVIWHPEIRLPRPPSLTRFARPPAVYPPSVSRTDHDVYQFARFRGNEVGNCKRGRTVTTQQITCVLHIRLEDRHARSTFSGTTAMRCWKGCRNGNGGTSRAATSIHSRKLPRRAWPALGHGPGDPKNTPHGENRPAR
jgi:hypothetical protein